MAKVLFVCMGNICRSPTAEAVFRALLEKHGLEKFIQADSAGTHGYHVGGEPDKRSQKAALKRGFDMSHLRARIVESKDFDEFDYIVAMDYDNLEDLKDISAPQYHSKISLLLDHDPNIEFVEVPDPYYGGLHGFDHVLNLVEAGSIALLEKIRVEHQLKKVL